MRVAAACTSILAAAVLAGCAARYSCPAPKGVSCKPISEVYRSTFGNATPPKAVKTTTAPSTPAKPPAPSSSAEGQPPIRSASKILRVWIAPWIDDEGDLHQEGYVYVVVDHGAWAFGVPATMQEPGSRDEAK